MSRYRVIVAPRARRQVDAIDEWWRTNRPSVPDLFLTELEKAMSLLELTPSIGHPHPSRAGVRRLLLASTQYHLYYELDISLHELRILAVWHTARGRGPKL